jgi:hypothetical protein
MLALTHYDDNGKLAAGHLFCSSELARQNWMKRLRSIGFDYLLPYHDTQSPYSIMFGTKTIRERGKRFEVRTGK